MSIRNAASTVARAIPGLALMRSNMASWRIDRTDGNITLRVPHRCPTPSGRRGRFPAGGRSAPSTACSPHPAQVRGAPAARPGRARGRPTRRRPAYEEVPLRINARVRSGRFAANTMAGGPPSLTPEDDGLSEAGGVHDGLDLGRSIIQRANLRDRVRQPDPGLVEHHDATERGEPVEEGLEFGHGPEQLDVADHRPDEDELDRPVAEHLIRQAQIAAAAYDVSATALSVRLPGASRTVSTASARACTLARASAPWPGRTTCSCPARCATW